MPSDATDIHTFEALHKTKISEGETRLMLAVLEEAVHCFQQYVVPTRPREQRLFQVAEDWFLDKDSDYIFSFEYICESLGLHPDPNPPGLDDLEGCKAKDRFTQAGDREPEKGAENPAYPKTKPNRQDWVVYRERTPNNGSKLSPGRVGDQPKGVIAVQLWRIVVDSGVTQLPVFIS
jgi:hypothetical protein